MKTRFRTAPIFAAAVIIGVSAASAGCGKYSYQNLKAMKAFKDANVAYQAQDWKKEV